MAKSTRPKSATSYKETAFGILHRSKIVAYEKEGVKKTQKYVIRLSNRKAKITPKLILKVHQVGFGFIFPKWAGKFRISDVIIGEYEPPHYSRVPELVRNLCDDLKIRLKHLHPLRQEEKLLAELISLSAWFQHRIVWIHPFNDYNGRVARLLTNLLLLNLGFPILTIRADTGKDRDRYVQAMKAADKQDFSKLESLLTNALRESLEKL